MTPDIIVDDISTWYSIKKSPEAMDTIKKLPSRLRDKTYDVIDKLQFEPRPPGHKASFGLGPPLLRLEVEGEYTLQYQVDDNKGLVLIGSIVRFSS